MKSQNPFFDIFKKTIALCAIFSLFLGSVPVEAATPSSDDAYIRDFFEELFGTRNPDFKNQDYKIGGNKIQDGSIKNQHITSDPSFRMSYTKISACPDNNILMYLGGIWSCSPVSDLLFQGATVGEFLTGNGKNTPLNVDTTKIQKRVWGTCETGKMLTGISSDGSVVCSTFGEVDGDVTNEIQNIIAGKGLLRDGSNNFGLMNCGNNEILLYNAITSQWACSALPSLTETDPTVNSLAKATLNCTAWQVPKWDAASNTWVCEKDSKLTDEEIAAMGFVKNANETDPTVKNFAKADLPTCTDGQVLKNNNGSFACVNGSGVGVEQDPNLFEKNLDKITVIEDGSFGIGTTNPGAKFHIKDVINPIFLNFEGATGSVVSFAHSSASGQFAFTNGWGSTPKELLRIDGMGNFGIGIPLPQGKLHVADLFDLSALVVKNGTVGIGTALPNSTFKLDVAGKIQAASTLDTDSAKTVTTKDYVDSKISAGVGSVVESDPLWNTDKLQYYTKTEIDASAFLKTETDPTVKNFAKADLPACTTGQVLRNNNGNLECVNGSGAGVETDPNLFQKNLDKITVTADGNVGIGSTNPSEKIDVAGNAKFSGKITSAKTIATDSDTTVTTKDYVDAKIGDVIVTETDPIFVASNLNKNITAGTDGSVGIANAKKLQFANNAGNFGTTSIFADPTNKLQIAAGSAAMSFDSVTGNVGIGTSSPSAKLHVNGGIKQERAERINLSGRNKTWLLSSYPKAQTGSGNSEAFIFNIYDSGDYDNISSKTVYVNRDGKVEIGLSSGQEDADIYPVEIRTFDDGTNINVYLVANNYDDFYTLDVVYNRLNTAISPTVAGDNSFVPTGSLVGNTATAPFNLRVGNDTRLAIGADGNSKFSGKMAIGGYNIDANYFFTAPSLFAGKGEFSELCIGSGTGTDCKTSWNQIVSAGGGILTETDPKLFEKNLDKIRVSNNGLISTTQNITDPTTNIAGMLNSLNLTATNADNAILHRGILGSVKVYGTKNFTSDVRGLEGSVYNYGGNSISNAVGGSFHTGVMGSGTINLARGLQVGIYNATPENGGKINTYQGISVGATDAYNNPNSMYGIMLDPSTKVGGTNKYGLYIGQVAGATNNFALYSAGGTNYFAGNVGIGTTTPSEKLTIHTSDLNPKRLMKLSSASANAQLTMGTNATGSGYVLDVGQWDNDGATNGNKSLSFANGGVESLRIASNGNVGIGTTNPQTALDVSGQIRVGATGKAGKIEFARPSDGIYQSSIGWNSDGTTFNTYFSGGGSKYQISSFNTVDASQYPIMTVLTTGNVGIGTTTPTEKLEITGNQKTSGKAAFGGYAIDANYTLTSPSIYGTKGEFAELCIGSGTGTDCKTSWNQIVSAGGGILTETDPKLFEKNLDKITVTSDGKIGVGTTSPGEKLEVNGNIKTSGRVYFDGGSFIGDSNAIGGNDIGIFASNNERLTIQNTGNIGIGTTTPTEKLEVAGGIKIGDALHAAAGTVRWNGTDFEGFDGTAWKSFTRGAGSATCSTVSSSAFATGDVTLSCPTGSIIQGASEGVEWQSNPEKVVFPFGSEKNATNTVLSLNCLAGKMCKLHMTCCGAE